MIIYKDLLQKLKNAGYSTYRIKQEHILSEGTLQKIRKGETLSIPVLDTICRVTGCQISDLIEYIPDEE